MPIQVNINGINKSINSPPPICINNTYKNSKDVKVNINGVWRNTLNAKKIYITGASNNGVIDQSKIKIPITLTTTSSSELYGWYESYGYNSGTCVTMLTGDLLTQWSKTGVSIKVNNIDQSLNDWSLRKDTPILFSPNQTMTICGNYARNNNSQYFNGSYCQYIDTYYLLKVVCP